VGVRRGRPRYAGMGMVAELVSVSGDETKERVGCSERGYGAVDRA
jgi:hypothetical protein